jgi:hypothetical protein
MLLHNTKDFALNDMAPQAASERAETGRDHESAVALYYIARQAGMTCA